MSKFAFGLLPRLQEVDWDTWRAHYPRGLGASAFSAPAWQQLMLQCAGPERELHMLVGEAGAQRFSLPVFVRQWRYRRVELVTHPIAYYVLPVECDKADSDCVAPLVLSAQTPMTCRFQWWLPPWMTGDRSLTTNDADTYVIELDGTYEDFLRTSVRKRFVENVRTSHRRGIEVIESPSDAEICEYFALYERVFAERTWSGGKFSLAFFRGVASSLDQAGKLILLRHEGRIVGGGVILFDRYAAHYFQGSTERTNGSVKPHLVLYDWLLREASARGLKYVNLGGVNDGNQSLAQFKCGWGARPVAIPQVSWAFDRRALANLLSVSSSGSIRGKLKRALGARAAAAGAPRLEQPLPPSPL